MNATARKQILVVDDEPMMTQSCHDYLATEGYGVLQAHDLAEARELLETEAIHLVLCDVTLKNGESGLDLFHELLPRSPFLAVCMMTANRDLQLATDCVRAGAFDYITKPFLRDDLLEAVDRALAQQGKLIAERRESEELIHVLARFPEDNPNPVLRVDSEGEILYSNHAGEPLLKHWKLRCGDVIPDSLLPLLRTGAATSSPNSQAHSEANASVDTAASPLKTNTVEVTSGHRIFSFTATAILDSTNYYLYGHDVTDWKRAERELIRLKNEAKALSCQDPVTGLANRHYLENRFEELARQASEENSHLAFILINLDNFKEINDIYGHGTGDRILIQAGQRIRHLLAANDILCRWGDDEIVVLKSDFEAVADIDSLCRSILDLGRSPIKAPGHTFPITLGIGYSLLPEDGTVLETLLTRATRALNTDHETGKNSWKGYHQLEKREIFRQSPDLLKRFYEAIKDNKIEVYYQPIIEASSGRVAAAEALARWTDPELGIISPENFIPEAEEHGLIGKLGQMVLRKGLGDLVQWRKSDLDVTLSVNLSRRQLLNEEFIAYVNRAIETRNLPPSCLTLELTERHGFFDTAIGKMRLGALAASGYRLSLDDFGSGYSSVSEIATMPFNELKIAMNLIQRIAENKEKKIVHAICLMGRALGLTIVAEGVQTAEQADMLRLMGVPRLQGFFFAKPMSAAEFFAFARGPAVCK